MKIACGKHNINAPQDNLLEEVSCLNANPLLPALQLIFVDVPHSACMANQIRYLLTGNINYIPTVVRTKIGYLNKQNKDKPSSTNRESKCHLTCIIVAGNMYNVKKTHWHILYFSNKINKQKYQILLKTIISWV